MGGLYGIGINSDQTSVSDDTTSVSGSPLYAHFAGRIALIGATPEIAITGLTVGHTYDFYIALLTYGAPATLGYRLYSGVGATGVKYVDQTGFIVPEGYVGDAIGFSHVSPAAFWADCGKVSFMAASTSLFIRCATDGSAAQVAMFGLKDTAGGSVPSTIDDLTCMFVG